MAKALVTQDCTQRLSITIFLILDAYRIIIGCFYVIFVPQLCPDASGDGTHACTVQENVTDLSLLNEAALGLNAISCAAMIAAFVIEYRREIWMVKHLEVDPKKPDTNLATEIVAYPKMEKSLKRKNYDYKAAFYTAAALSLVNLVVSGFLVADYYDGFKTTTTFITNTLLIVQRVAKSIQIARTCDKETKAQSVYLLEPVTFNTIDPDYLKPDPVPEIKMIESPMKKEEV